MIHRASIIVVAFALLVCSCKEDARVASHRGRADSTATHDTDNDDYISYTVDPKHQDLRLYWKDDKGQLFRSFQSLRTWLGGRKKKLVFAMNGGMFMEDNSPLGLFIQDGKIITPINKRSATANFYLKPNGVFYITKSNDAVVCATEKFSNSGKVKYATQSGPMLVIDGKIHPAFKKGSFNINIRNGVGILPNGKPIFIMSKSFVSFYDFAMYFKELGCKNALFLDGSISRTYLPEKNSNQLDGDFGVIIAVTSGR